MCGIAGIATQDSNLNLSPLIRRMNTSMAHRGPDAEGVWTDLHIGLGQRRLSIIDLSEAANQPMSDHTGRYKLVYNGEIYNYRELRAQIPGYPFRTQSDSELILAAYQAWGADCLLRFRGMFAFAIWDRQEKSLFLARDPFGVKPLYYSSTRSGHFLFASEMRALLNTGLVSRDLDKDSIQDFLIDQTVYSPHTILEDIRQLQAGHFIRYNSGSFEETDYLSDFHNALSARAGTDDDQDLIALLRQSVSRRMVSDVPVGAFLSGGIDSSSLVALMAEQSTQPVKTFTIAFADKRFDESGYARIIVDKYATDHTEFQLGPEDFLAMIPEVLAAQDSPSGDGPNTYLVSKLTHEAGIKVALTGLGGDELFAGYHHFQRWKKLKEHPLLAIWSQFPRAWRKKLIRVLQGQVSDPKYWRILELLKVGRYSIDQVYPIMRQVFTQPEYAAVLTHSDGQNRIEAQLRNQLGWLEKLPVFSQFTMAELLGYTGNVLLKDTDQMSMAHSLEIREPFFDIDLISWVLKQPDSAKIGSAPKQMLVQAMGNLLPGEIVHRPKMGFSFPWRDWIFGPLKPMAMDYLQSLEKRPEFNARGIAAIRKRLASDDPSLPWTRVWYLLTLSAWMENNLSAIQVQNQNILSPYRA